MSDFFMMDYLTWLGGIASAIVVAGALVTLGMHLMQSHIRSHTLPVSRAKSRELRLAEYLEQRGMELSWHAVDTVERDVQHRGFQRIKWRDTDGRLWRLVNEHNGDFPLAKTKLIETR